MIRWYESCDPTDGPVILYRSYQVSWFSRLKEWATRDPVGRADDDLLGPLILNEGCWESRLTIRGKPICFQIGGRYSPDPALIARARTMILSFDEFEAGVNAFLDTEASRDFWAPFAAEIRSLSIRDVCLFWPRRLDDGMVFFDGPDECRCWRCDLMGMKPTGLGYDS